MKIGERGQVTVPKDIRERFGLGPNTDVEFRVVSGSIVLKKKSARTNFKNWKGHCKKTFSALGNTSVDQFIEDVRGR